MSHSCVPALWTTHDPNIRSSPQTGLQRMTQSTSTGTINLLRPRQKQPSLMLTGQCIKMAMSWLVNPELIGPEKTRHSSTSGSLVAENLRSLRRERWGTAAHRRSGGRVQSRSLSCIPRATRNQHKHTPPTPSDSPTHSKDIMEVCMARVGRSDVLHFTNPNSIPPLILPEATKRYWKLQTSQLCTLGPLSVRNTASTQ